MFNSENPFISVCQYVILVQTALTSDPAASEGQVSINIQGEYGDTGERKLSGKSPWKPGEEASFIIESVSLGALTKIDQERSSMMPMMAAGEFLLRRR